MDIKHRIQSNKQWGLSMKKKVLGIVIACTILIGLLAFCINHQQGTNNPETEATPETAVSEIKKTEDSVETNIAISESNSSNESLADDDSEVTSTEKPEATATPQVTATPEPVQATPQPTAVPQPVVTEVPQPEQSYDDGGAGAYDDWFDDSWTGVSDEEYQAALDAWDDSVSFE